MKTLYEKIGRRYVPAVVDREYDKERINVGTFRLLHVYKDGAGYYEYDVTPDTAGWHAAAMIAKHAMREAIIDASRAVPQNRAGKPYTKKQLALIEQFRVDMDAAGALRPNWWEYTTPDAIARAGADAVLAHAIGVPSVD